MLDLTLRLYYPAKRFLPRRLQLALRRSLVAYKLNMSLITRGISCPG